MPRITPGVTELRMQLATVGPVLPSAVLNTYGAALNLTSPRAGGGIVPLMIRASVANPLNIITLRIRPTWSDGTTGAGVLWGQFANPGELLQAGLMVESFNGISAPAPGPAAAVAGCYDSTLDLSAFWKAGMTLKELAFDCKSAQNADTASITVTYWGLYT